MYGDCRGRDVIEKECHSAGTLHESMFNCVMSGACRSVRGQRNILEPGRRCIAGLLLQLEL